MELTEKTYKPNIAQVGQPVLRQKAKVVEDILAEDCQQLIKQMMSTVEQAGGVGIAAPQIF
ncbi:peptide deformylase [Pseudoalteromonas phenolica]|nr:peptide deformylase [Pseudoalteromonas phenolica]